VETGVEGAGLAGVTICSSGAEGVGATGMEDSEEDCLLMFFRGYIFSSNVTWQETYKR